VGLGGEVRHGVDALVLHEPVDELLVADVALHEAEVGLALGVLEVQRAPRVRERVQHHHPVLRMRLQPMVQEIRADEAGAAGDEDLTHL